MFKRIVFLVSCFFVGSFVRAMDYAVEPMHVDEIYAKCFNKLANWDHKGARNGLLYVKDHLHLSKIGLTSLIIESALRIVDQEEHRRAFARMYDKPMRLPLQNRLQSPIDRVRIADKPMQLPAKNVLQSPIDRLVEPMFPLAIQEESRYDLIASEDLQSLAWYHDDITQDDDELIDSCDASKTASILTNDQKAHAIYAIGSKRSNRNGQPAGKRQFRVSQDSTDECLAAIPNRQLLVYANQYRESDNLELAKRYYQALLARNNSSELLPAFKGSAHYWMGSIYLQEGNRDKAYEHFQLASKSSHKKMSAAARVLLNNLQK